MYSKLDELIKKYETDSISDEETWYALAIEEGEKIIQGFIEEDWKMLFKELLNKSNIWKSRLISILNDYNDINQLKIILLLADDFHDETLYAINEYLMNCDVIVMDRYNIIIEEIKNHKNNLYEFDLNKLLDDLKKKVDKRDLKIFTDNIEEEALRQIDELLDQDAFRDSKVRIMPDVHSGKSCVIGFTGDLGDKVIPNIVGGDIGCGMLCVSLGKVDIDYKKLDDFISSSIPNGLAVNDQKIVDFDLTRLYCYSRLKDTGRLENAIGSLGGGNHFIEIDEAEDGEKYLVIHTGSRNLGTQVAAYYQNLADQICNHGILEFSERREQLIKQYKEEGREQEIQKALTDLAKEYENFEPRVPSEFAYLEGKYREAYLHDMKICQEFAVLNRYTIAKRITEHMGWKLDDYFESVHNYISFDDNIVRKGAISAREGERVIIPINMRDGCIIGVGKGNSDWNYSAPHGAGRIMSRKEARERVNLEEYREAMSGIYTTSVTEETVDEAPFVYKSLEEILYHITPTVEVTRVIKPVYNFKASGAQLFDDKEEVSAKTK
jgi:RNA-splicing ligase RtcB